MLCLHEAACMERPSMRSLHAMMEEQIAASPVLGEHLPHCDMSLLDSMGAVLLPLRLMPHVWPGPGRTPCMVLTDRL
jgi:hypothetical protein